MTQLNVKGNIYTDDDDPRTGMGVGGWRKRFMPMISDVMAEMEEKFAYLIALVGNGYSAARDAAASAASAVSAPGTSATSITSLTIDTGNFSCLIQPGKVIVPGMSIKVAITAAASNWMHGDVLSYDGATGLLQFNSTRTQGGGTSEAWTVSLSSPSYQNGVTGGAASSIATGAAPLQLTAASPRYQQVVAAGGAGVIILPDATTMAPGSNVFQLDNVRHATANDLGELVVKDKTGKVLGFIPALSSAAVHLLNNSSVAGVWSLPQANRVGILSRTTKAFPSPVGGPTGTYIKAVALDINYTFLVVYGANGIFGIVHDGATDTYGAPTLISGSPSTGTDSLLAATAVDSSTVLIVSTFQNSSLLAVRTVSTSGTTIGTIKTAAAFTTTGNAIITSILDIVSVGAAFVVSFMAGTTSMRMLAINPVGSTPSLGAEIINATVGPATVVPVTSTTLMVLTTTATALTAKAYSLSGVTLSAGSTASLTLSSYEGIMIRYTSANRFAIVYFNAGVKCAMLTLTSTSPAFSAAVAVSSASLTTINPATGYTASDSSGNSFMIAMTGVNVNGVNMVEFLQVGDAGTGAPSLFANTALARAFSQPASVAFVGPWGPGFLGVNDYVFLVTTAKEVGCFNFLSGGGGVIWNEGESRGALPTSALLPVPTAPFAPPRSRNVLFANSYGLAGKFAAAVMGDGTKRSALFASEANLSETVAPVPLIADATVYSARVANDSSVLWLAQNLSPETNVVLQKVKMT